MTHPERFWIGPNYSDRRFLVLGESWYGEYAGNLVTDDGYIRAYLEGSQPDPMYSRIANACMEDSSLLARRKYWNAVMFTNFVQCVGETRANRPTIAIYKAARARLAGLLVSHKPSGVWILGKEQSEYSAPVAKEVGIPVEVSAHPTSYGLNNSALGASWKALLAKLQPCDRDQ